MDEMNAKEARQRMEEGRLYPPGDEEIMERQFACLEKLYDFNDTRPSELAKRQELLREMFGAIGEGCYIEPPLHSNWGGRHVPVSYTHLPPFPSWKRQRYNRQAPAGA